ncbi:MAG: hypothetical protein H7X71_05955 [Chitinophagales bacterium]|nr:hypothetical protein [Chitinophagales bacterium]
MFLGKAWYRIKTPDGKMKGFVNSEYAWLPLDLRMFLYKEKGVWMISAIIAGD